MKSTFATAIQKGIDGDKVYEVVVKVTVAAKNPGDAIVKAMNAGHWAHAAIADVRELQY